MPIHNNCMFEQYFKELGFSENEAKVFKAIYSLGTKPASTIAKYLGLERTTVYKIITRLVGENLIYETSKGGIKHFYIPDVNILKKYTDDKINKYKKLENKYDAIKTELIQFDQIKDNKIPKISIFDGNNGIKNVYSDIFNKTINNKYISIRLFASNTVDSQVSLNSDLKKDRENLFSSLSKNKVSIETFLGNGISLMESISKTYDIDSISNIGASNSAVNIFLVGDTIYIIIFKDSPFAIKIESEDLAFTMHFLFDKIETK